MLRLGKNFLLSGLLGLIVSLLLPQAAGADTTRLSSFTAHTGPVRLVGMQDRFDLYVPVASTVTLEDVVLDLKLARSVALLAHRSALSVRLNETTLAQIPYNPDQPVSTARVRIPAELWRPGFNKLTLAAVQHYAERCEDISAPELWSEVDLYHSRLTYRVREKKSPLRLEDLSGIFSPGIGGHGEVLLLTSPEREWNDPAHALHEALPTVAQALALRRDFAPLKIIHGTWQNDRNSPSAYLPGDRSRIHVLIGTKGELGKILPTALLDKISGPHLRIDRLGAGKHKEAIRLIVSGNSEGDLLLAARTLAEMDDRLNPVKGTTILSRDVDDALPLAARRFLQPEKRYTFAALGTPTRTLSGSGGRKLRLNIPVGADYYSLESAQAELLLDFGYGAGMGAGSIMNLYLNGEYIHGHAFNRSEGAAFRGYRINLPSRKFVPGMNTLEFDFTLRTPTLSGECRSIPGEHLLVQVLGSSTLTLPAAQAISEQPNLEIFAATAYPYISPSSVTPTRIIAGDATMLGTALSLAGKLAQAAGVPSDSVRLDVGIPEEPRGNALLLATPAMLPSDLYSGWKGAVGRSIAWPYRMLNDLRDSYENRTVSLEKTRSKPRLSGTITQARGLGDLGVMLALKNPYDSTPGTLTLLLADSAEMLESRFDELAAPALWNQLRGDLSVWRGEKEPMLTMQVADTYVVGASGWYDRLLLTLSNNPWYVAGVLLIVIALLSLFAYRYIRARHTEKMGE